MFGLFKSNSPEDKLKAELKKILEANVKDAIREAGGNDMLSGMFIENGIAHAYKSFTNNAQDLGVAYGLSYEKTISLIKEITNSVRNKHLVNPQQIR